MMSLLLFPVALAAIGLLSALMWHAKQSDMMWRLCRTTAWSSAILLALFCLVVAISIGVFFLPAAVAAVVGTTLRRKRQVDA